MRTASRSVLIIETLLTSYITKIIVCLQNLREKKNVFPSKSLNWRKVKPHAKKKVEIRCVAHSKFLLINVKNLNTKNTAF